MKILRIVCAFGGSLSLVLSMSAQTFTTLHSFDATDGQDPMRGLVQATNGDLYGTTYGGVHDSGEIDYGTVFKITPSGTLTTLYTFCPTDENCTDGVNPDGVLILDTNGNLYGTTFAGGANSAGTVFKITPSGTLTTLYSFCSQSGCTDGANPAGGLVEATNGDLYGTTYGGGANTTCLPGVLESGCGTVFKITLSGTLTTLYSFCSRSGCTDGSYPTAALIQATNGNLYGTTNLGANNQGGYGGTVFEITPSGKLTKLYSFCSKTDCADGEVPNGGLVQASNGDFYGTTFYGGGAASPYGTVFKITPTGTLTTLHIFDVTDGTNPGGTLIQATDGNLYGTTYQHGTDNGGGGGGTIFKITPSGALTTLYNFCSRSECTDGTEPEVAGLVQDTNGTFYGTTLYGGANSTTCAYGCGTVYSLSVGLGPFVEIQQTSGKEGSKVGILGQGFGSSSVVKFDGTKATTIVLSGTTFITATVPAGALTGAVTVTTGTTTLTSTKAFKVLPTITSFSPTSGPVGTSVTITGTGLEQTSKVAFDGKSATFTVVKNTEVTADVPTGTATGKITVTTKGGSATSATSFTVTAGQCTPEGQQCPPQRPPCCSGLICVEGDRAYCEPGHWKTLPGQARSGTGWTPTGSTSFTVN
jgi:uncharacterized repeat protein (TIGR03803 family)